MKTLYLHIGTPKTATSSIQVFLKENREQLRDYNYDFPLMPFQCPDLDPSSGRNGHFLVFRDSLIKKDPSPEAQRRREERLSIGLDVLHDAFKQCDNVILTDESLWISTAYDSRNYLQILSEDAAKYGYAVKIIVYLRRQDLFISSFWNENIKDVKIKRSLPNYVKHTMKVRPLYLEYDKTLQLIADTFGAENLIVRRFEPSAWKDHSVISDFLNALGLDPDVSFSYPEEERNLRLTDNAAEIQRIINKNESLPFEEKKYLSRFTKELSLDTEKKSAYSRFTPQETAAFLSHFEEGNQYVAQTYIGDGKPLFSDEIADLPLWKADNPEMQKDFMRFYLSVINDLYRQLDELESFRNKVRHPLHYLREKIFSR